jgi:NTE family protein
VLGGGGPVGIGWESGLAVGLAGGGVDLAQADAIYGTSAGSFVGAQLALGFDIAKTAALLIETSAAAVAASTGPSITAGLQALTDVVTAAVDAGTPAEEVRRSLGRLALEAEVVSESEFLDLFGVFTGCPWPDSFSCTALDTETAEFVVWGARSDVDLQRAVASSCAVPLVCPPITIGGRRYMDGGVRSPLNADLARGHARALVVSVTILPGPDSPGPNSAVPNGSRSKNSSGPAGSGPHGSGPHGSGRHGSGPHGSGPHGSGPHGSGPHGSGPHGSGLDGDALTAGFVDEISMLRSSGTVVEVIEPHAEFLEVSGWGTSLMDIGKAGQAFTVGVRQGLEEASRIAHLWGTGDGRSRNEQ